MKDIFKVISQGLISPKHYIEARHFATRKVLIFTLIPILLMTSQILSKVIPVQQSIQDQIYQVGPHIPNFSYSDNILNFTDNSKALYYQSDDVQIVIDPQLKANPIFHNIPIQQEKLNRIKTDALFQAYLLGDRIILNFDGNTYEIENTQDLMPNRQALLSVLETIKHPPLWYYLILFLSLFIYSSLSYYMIILFTSLFLSLFNRYLNQSVDFINRFKITIPLTFVPLMGLEILKLIIGDFTLPFLLFGPFVLFLYYLAFKDYTAYVQDVIQVSKRVLKQHLQMEEELLKTNSEYKILKFQQNKLKESYRELSNKFKESNKSEDKASYQRQIHSLENEIIQLEKKLQDIIIRHNAKK